MGRGLLSACATRYFYMVSTHERALFLFLFLFQSDLFSISFSTEKTQVRHCEAHTRCRGAGAGRAAGRAWASHLGQPWGGAAERQSRTAQLRLPDGALQVRGRGRVGVGVGEGAGRGRWARALGEGAALRCWWGPGGARRARRARGPWRESGGHQWRACSSIRVSVLCCECAGSAILGMIEAMSSGKPHQAPTLYLLPPVGHSGTWAWRAAGD